MKNKYISEYFEEGMEHHCQCDIYSDGECSCGGTKYNELTCQTLRKLAKKWNIRLPKIKSAYDDMCCEPNYFYCNFDVKCGCLGDRIYFHLPVTTEKEFLKAICKKYNACIKSIKQDLKNV